VRWALVLAFVVGGCSFEHAFGVISGTQDAPTADTEPIDAMHDAMPDAEALCRVGVMNTTGIDRGRVGGDGGSENFPPLACANPGDQIIGVALRMSNQDTLYGQRSAHGIRIGCAPVTVRASGIGTIGTVTTYDLIGNGNFDWTPSTWTQMTVCKPGWILSGLSTHTTNRGDLFIDVSITCSQVGPSGTLVASEVIYVDGSLDESDGADAATCDPGEVIVRMPNRSGAGLDSVNLWCTTPTCS
jgi:hypothetical protein